MTSRVKLSFGDTRIVLPLSKIEGTTIASLLTTASTRFQSAGVLPVTDRFIEARTEDGYLLSDGDQIADVVGNDRISLINRAKWIEEFRAAESPEYWFGLEGYDNLFSKKRIINVGYARRRGCICVSWWIGNELANYEVFDRDGMKFGKNGEVLIHSKSGSSNGNEWEMSAFFVVENNKPASVKLLVKCSNDPQAAIKTCPIIFQENSISCGTEVVIQGNWPPAPQKQYSLPPTKRVGEIIQNDPPVTARDYVSLPNKSVGESALEISQMCDISPMQHRDKSATHQHLRCEFSVTNNSVLDTHISLFNVEYQDSTGSWKTFTRVTRGVRDKDWNFPQAATDAYIVIARGVQKFAVNATLTLPHLDHLTTRVNSLHPALPCPLNLRYTFTDQDGKTSVLTSAVTSRGIDNYDLARIRRVYANEIEHLSFVDHKESCDRFCAFYVQKGTDSYVRILPSSNYTYLGPAKLHDETYEAIKAGQTEREITSYSEGNTFHGTVHLLVDLEAKYAYAIRFQLRAGENSIDESYLLPVSVWNTQS